MYILSFPFVVLISLLILNPPLNLYSMSGKLKRRRFQFGFTALLLVFVVVAFVAWMYGDRSPNRPVTVCFRVEHLGTQEPVTEFRFRYDISSQHASVQKDEWIVVESKQGVAEIRAPASCRLAIQFQAEGYIFHPNRRKVIELYADGPNYRTKRIDLIRGVTFEGTVADAETNNPISAATIKFQDSWRAYVDEAGGTTGKDGLFKYTGISRKKTAHVDHPEYFSVTLPLESVNFDEPLKIRLKKAPLVRDEDGAPLAGVSIAVSAPLRSVSETMSREDGSFTARIPADGLDGGISVKAYKKGYLFLEQKTELYKAEELELKLTRCLKFNAAVVDDTGQQVNEFKVLALSHLPKTPAGALEVRYSTGRFQVDFFADGKHWLVVRAKGHAVWSKRMEFDDGSPEQEIRLSKGGKISGSLRLPASLVGAAEIHLVPKLDIDSLRNDSPITQAAQLELLEEFLTDTVGVINNSPFDFQDVSAGQYELRVYGKGITPVEMPVTASGDSIDLDRIVVKGGGSIKGRIFYPGTVPRSPWKFGRGELKLRNSSAPPIPFMADESGGFEIVGAPAGEVVISVNTIRGVETDTAAISVGKTTTVDLFAK
jgi:hypothetical protein